MLLQTENYSLTNECSRLKGAERSIASLRGRVEELQTREDAAHKQMLMMHSEKRSINRQLAEALEANRRAHAHVRLLAADKVELEQEMQMMKEAGRSQLRAGGNHGEQDEQLKASQTLGANKFRPSTPRLGASRGRKGDGGAVHQEDSAVSGPQESSDKGGRLAADDRRRAIEAANRVRESLAPASPNCFWS